MIVLAIDPGTRPGAAVLQDGIVVRVSHDLNHIQGWAIDYAPRFVWGVVACESQWYYGGKGAPDVNDLLKLAFRAGWQLRSVPALRHLRIPPQVWRGGSSANKAQMQRRILRDLTPAETELFRGIPEARHGDILDSIGIGKCAARIAPTTTEYDYK